MAHVEKRRALGYGFIAQYLNVVKAHMQAAGQVHAEVERLTQRIEPIVGNNAAPVGNADDQRPRALLRRLGNRNIGHTGARIAAL